MVDNVRVNQLEMELEQARNRILDEHKNALFEAAEDNNLKKIKRLVEKEKCVPLDCWDKNLQTVARIAAKNGYLEIVKYVADNTPSILSFRDRYGDTVLHLPNEQNVLEIIKYLEEKFKDDIPEWPRHDYHSMGVHSAAKFGHWQVLKYFVETKNSDVNAPDDKGRPPIFTAVENKHTDIFRYLVEERNANLTALDENEDNILFVANSADDMTTIKYVLDEKKANLDINWQNAMRNTLVHRATILNRLDILKYLVEEKHAEVNVLGHENRTALSHASGRNFLEACQYLVEHGADPQIRDKFGYYPHQRAWFKNVTAYMKNISYPPNVSAVAPRTRRGAIDFQSVRLVHDNPASTGFDSDGQTSIDAVYTSQLPNFLFVAQWIFGGTPSRPSLPAGTTLYSRMDPIAEDAVDDHAIFFER